ncbi:MAG: MarR family transcriptional regulator [Methanobrevibacter sp.]|nr:MarR family transcriptional regulator [Methanobrevibacter sp.]
MIRYDEIIENSPHLICHLISLTKTHDFYMNYHIKNETDILPSQYFMLMFLYYEMGTNQSDIAKACLMDRSGVSRAFKDFEEKGLLTREVDENNKRAYKINLTKKGKETAECLAKKEAEWDKLIFDELNVDHDELMELLSRLAMKSLIFNREIL